MKISDLKDKKIVILGFGKEGQALFDFLKNRQIGEIDVVDEKATISQNQQFNFASAKFITKPFESIDLNYYDVILRSPGISYKRISSLVLDKSKISSAIDLMLSSASCIKVGITGTKGKSTTVKILQRMLEKSGKEVVVGGNIGLVPLDKIDSLSENSFLLLELSSFQLEVLSVSPDIAIVLPISSDHLDYHTSPDEYIDAKSTISKFQKEGDKLIYYNDDIGSIIAEKSQAEKFSFSDKQAVANCIVAEKAVICKKDGVGEAVYEDLLRYSNELKIPFVNIICAFCFAYALDLHFEVSEIFSSFEKMPFRITLSKVVDGVRFYNDSASTNPASAVEAIKTMDGRFILIAGGSSKGLSYEQMAKRLVQNPNAMAIFLTGNTSLQIKSDLDRAEFNRQIEVVGNLHEAVEQAFDFAKKNSIENILFSPASASFDNFKNYLDRGEKFNEIVETL